MPAIFTTTANSYYSPAYDQKKKKLLQGMRGLSTFPWRFGGELECECGTSH